VAGRIKGSKNKTVTITIQFKGKLSDNSTKSLLGVMEEVFTSHDLNGTLELREE